MTTTLPPFLARLAITGYDASRRVIREPIAWTWRGIIARTHAVEICGQTGSGKSTFTTLLAVAVANPTSTPVALLGHEVTPAPEGQRVLIVNEENSRQSAVALIDRAIEILALPARETWARIVLVSRGNVAAHWIEDNDDDTSEDDERTDEDRDRAVRARLHDPSTAWEAIIAAAYAGAWAFIVLDTRAKILRLGETNSEDAQADASRMLTQLVESARCAVAVASHTRKGATGDDLDDVSGSAQRAGGADVIILASAERTKGKVTATKLVVAKLRDSDGDEHPEPMRFTVAKIAGAWKLTTEASDDDKDPAHERIYRHLRDAQAEQSNNDIRRALGLSGATVREAIKMLRAARRVKSREGRRGSNACWVHKAIPAWSDVMPEAARSTAARRRRSAASNGASHTGILGLGGPTDV
jgi:energy-coupling factor transporter ATP-binding protein EcfA2